MKNLVLLLATILSAGMPEAQASEESFWNADSLSLQGDCNGEDTETSILGNEFSINTTHMNITVKKPEHAIEISKDCKVDIFANVPAGQYVKEVYQEIKYFLDKSAVAKVSLEASFANIFSLSPLPFEITPTSIQYPGGSPSGKAVEYDYFINQRLIALPMEAQCKKNDKQRNFEFHAGLKVATENTLADSGDVEITDVSIRFAPGSSGRLLELCPGL